MTGQLDQKTNGHLIDLFAGVTKGDIDRLCRVAIELTDINPALTDRRDFRADMQELTTHFQECDLRHLDITRLLADFILTEKTLSSGQGQSSVALPSEQ